MGPFILGVLCNASRADQTACALRRLLRRRSPESLCALVFTLEGYDAAALRVSGTLVAPGHISEATAPLPSVVLNLSVQRRRADVKKLRAMCADAPTFVLNQSNRPRLAAIEAMLRSDEAAAALVRDDAKAQEEAPAETDRPPRCAGCLWRGEDGWRVVFARTRGGIPDAKAGEGPEGEKPPRSRRFDQAAARPAGAREAMRAAVVCGGR